MIICHHIYDLFKSPSQSSVMNAHSTLKVIHIDAYYGSVCECLTTIYHGLGSKPQGLSEY